MFTQVVTYMNLQWMELAWAQKDELIVFQIKREELMLVPQMCVMGLCSSSREIEERLYEHFQHANIIRGPVHYFQR